MPLTYVEGFLSHHSNEENILARLSRFEGYIHNHKMLPGNIFGLILKNKMAFFRLSAKEFCWPSKADGIIGRAKKTKFAKNIWELVIEKRHHFTPPNG